MTSSLAKNKLNKSLAHIFRRFFYNILVLMFLNIHMLFIVLQTYDQQFTLTTKKSLHIIFKVIFTKFACSVKSCRHISSPKQHC